MDFAIFSKGLAAQVVIALSIFWVRRGSSLASRVAMIFAARSSLLMEVWGEVTVETGEVCLFAVVTVQTALGCEEADRALYSSGLRTAMLAFFVHALWVGRVTGSGWERAF